MENTNEMTIIFDSYSSNEAFARVAVAAFMTSLNPTVEEVADVKTAVSEAVTNAIIHGYESRIEKITLRCKTPVGYFVYRDRRSWKRNGRCKEGDGTVIYYKTGA